MVDQMAQPPPDVGRPEKCSLCNAFSPLNADSPALEGFCMRYPPVPRFGSYVGQPGPGVPQVESYFPVVDAGWWCREFSSTPVAGVKPAP